MAGLIAELDALLEPALRDDYEIIVVDDASPDGTAEIARNLAGRHPRLRVVERKGERGLATAVVRGFQEARGDVLAVMDGDLQHPPETTLALYREMERGAELAVASRHVEGGGVSDWSLTRRVISRIAQLIGILVLPAQLARVSDPMSGYFMVRRSVLDGVALNPIGYKILVEVLARAKIQWIAEIGYVFRERREGGSKATLRVYFEYLLHLLRLRWATLHEARLVRFCVVGASGVIVDMGLLFLLSDPTMLGFGLTRSKVVAAEMAIVNNFLWNDAWTFRDAARAEPGLPAKFRRFLGYNAICIAGVALNVIILNLLFNLAGVNRYIANAIAIVAVTAWNYGMNKRLNWASPKR
jgi:dolichol-phosphate mannosyltransferase